jgi:hypothetical protein
VLSNRSHDHHAIDMNVTQDSKGIYITDMVMDMGFPKKDRLCFVFDAQILCTTGYASLVRGPWLGWLGPGFSGLSDERPIRLIATVNFCA